jgi:prolipoprotein diacylglyceryltransferase
MLFWTYLGVYSLGRFFVQFYRQDTPFALGLSQAQLLSVLTVMVAVWALVLQAQRARRLGPSEPWARRASVKVQAAPEPEVPEHAPLSS